MIKGELSTFKIPVSSTVWFFERKNSWKLRPYAGEWMSADINRMATISPNGPIQGKPLTIKLKDDHYLLLTEAALYGYSGMRLMMNNEGAFQANFTEDEFTRTVDKTPWRVVLVADDLNQLVNSDIISSLNPAPDKTLFPDTSYIKPGRCVWSWMTRDSNYMKPVNEKHFIDMAAKLNFEYSLIDDGWETAWPQKWRQLKELCDYGKQKNVQLWVWKDSKYIRDSSARVEFLDSVKKAGVAGIKVDFMNSEAAELVDFDISLLKECAARQLIVDLHGCQAPSGEERTYPNQLTREGIRGLELNGMAEGPITASHNAALPFTRFVVGPGDYTPGLFSKPGKTTWAQQLACMYLFDSPLFCLAENPKYILDDPNLRQIVPFLKELPVTWDETIVLPGSDIGKLAAFARRKENAWYIAIINGENTAKRYTFTLDFLKKSGVCKSLTIADEPGNKPGLSTVINNKLRYEKPVSLLLQGNGGCVMKFVKGP